LSGNRRCFLSPAKVHFIPKNPRTETWDSEAKIVL
jgi:hypothetical protein